MSTKEPFVSSGAIESITPAEHKIHGIHWQVTRMRVPDGWLVTNAAIERGEANTVSLATAFVADVDGSWEIRDPMAEAIAHLEARILGRLQ